MCCFLCQFIRFVLLAFMNLSRPIFMYQYNVCWTNQWQKNIILDFHWPSAYDMQQSIIHGLTVWAVPRKMLKVCELARMDKVSRWKRKMVSCHLRCWHFATLKKWAEKSQPVYKFFPVYVILLVWLPHLWCFTHTHTHTHKHMHARTHTHSCNYSSC